MFCKAMVFTPLIPKLTASFSMLMVFPYLPFPAFKLLSDPRPDPEHPLLIQCHRPQFCLAIAPWGRVPVPSGRVPVPGGPRAAAGGLGATRGS